VEDLCKPVYCQLFSALVAQAEGGGDGTAGGLPDGGVIAPPGGTCKTLPEVQCDDNDECTSDQCDTYTGQCIYGVVTLDLDGDGYRGPRVGTLAGDPGSCGDDCNDANELAHPGGVEVCDGVDNDCNGVVDDNSTYVPLAKDAIRLSSDIDPAGPGGIAWSGSSYATVYTGTSGGFDLFRNMLTPNGDPIPPGETLLTLANADASGGPIVWVGDRYGLAWQDRRDGDYEVYFTILDENGEKVHADTRLTEAFGFSVNVALTWNGTEFITVWQDERDGLFNLYGQRISVDSEPIGENVAMTDPQGGFGNEGPSVAAGVTTVGVAWTVGDAFTHFIQFQTFTPELAASSTPISITNGTTDAVYPTVVWNNDRYVVAWFDKSANPKAIYAAALNEAGEIIVPPTPISEPGSFRSRYPNLRPLGDRLLVVYSDDRDQNDGYELYSRMIGTDLVPISAEARLTQDKRDSIYPVATFGPEGDVGILFRDDRENGEHHVFFMNLGCVTSPVP
jgi:hypothetical protein